MSSIANRIDIIHTRIAAAARRAGRDPAEVTLIAVTKTHPPQVIAEALVAGARHLGENRVQEAEAKIAALASCRPQPVWHLIGHLQRNKAKLAAGLFAMIHSLDSLRLAEALDRHVAELQTRRQGDTETGDTEIRRQGDKERHDHDAQSPGLPASRSPGLPVSRSPGLPVSFSGKLPVLLQVNVSGEASKEGFALPGGVANGERLAGFLAEVERIVALPHLAVCGLMTIPPFGPDPEAARPHFRALRLLRDELARRVPAAWSQLSMGMTDDFEVAVEEGATMVRVGRAIFGEREG